MTNNEGGTPPVGSNASPGGLVMIAHGAGNLQWVGNGFVNRFIFMDSDTLDNIKNAWTSMLDTGSHNGTYMGVITLRGSTNIGGWHTNCGRVSAECTTTIEGPYGDPSFVAANNGLFNITTSNMVTFTDNLPNHDVRIINTNPGAPTTNLQLNLGSTNFGGREFNALIVNDVGSLTLGTSPIYATGIPAGTAITGPRWIRCMADNTISPPPPFDVNWSAQTHRTIIPPTNYTKTTSPNNGTWYCGL